MAVLDQIIFDCERPSALARFWAGVLDGYRVRAYDEAEIARLAALGFAPETDPTVLVDGPGPSLCFQQGVRLSTARGRLHVDLAAGDRAREIARLRALGATVQRETSGYTVLCDPEGNRFCVVQR